jgi:hypothetical protein
MIIEGRMTRKNNMMLLDRVLIKHIRKIRIYTQWGSKPLASSTA